MVNKAGRIGGHGFTPKVIWAIVESKREMLWSAIGGTAGFEKNLCATVPPSRR